MKRINKVLLFGVLPVGVLAVGACATVFLLLDRITTSFSAFVPEETTVNARTQFEHEFPIAFHLLVNDDRYAVSAFRVQRGLGGRWGRLALRRRSPTSSRQGTVEELIRAFQEGGWQRVDPPRSLGSATTLFDALDGQLSEDDLDFVYSPASPEPEAPDCNCRVFVSANGAYVVAYCEMAW